MRLQTAKSIRKKHLHMRKGDGNENSSNKKSTRIKLLTLYKWSYSWTWLIWLIEYNIICVTHMLTPTVPSQVLVQKGSNSDLFILFNDTETKELKLCQVSV